MLDIKLVGGRSVSVASEECLQASTPFETFSQQSRGASRRYAISPHFYSLCGDWTTDSVWKQDLADDNSYSPRPVREADALSEYLLHVFEYGTSIQASSILFYRQDCIAFLDDTAFLMYSTSLNWNPLWMLKIT